MGYRGKVVRQGGYMYRKSQDDPGFNTKKVNRDLKLNPQGDSNHDLSLTLWTLWIVLVYRLTVTGSNRFPPTQLLTQVYFSSEYLIRQDVKKSNGWMRVGIERRVRLRANT